MDCAFIGWIDIPRQVTYPKTFFLKPIFEKVIGD